MFPKINIQSQLFLAEMSNQPMRMQFLENTEGPLSVHLCVWIHVCVCGFVCVCIWTPELDVEGLSQSFSTLFLKQGPT